MTSTKEKFYTRVNLKHRLLEIKLTGQWTEKEAEEYSKIFQTSVDEISEKGLVPFKVLNDLTDFPKLLPAVREILQDEYTCYAIKRGLIMSARFSKQTRTLLQFKSIGVNAKHIMANHTAYFSDFSTRREALEWLEVPFFSRDSK